ncbi:hypothetical protein [Microvirga soli]|uniref:hypothetical protein n=1 Tax=Microvirga soli TaxID=1854496 RepID=UPI00191E4CD7|nr:hypothetical protein [Microvirga soli]
MIARALERTVSLWPDVEYANQFVHAVAHWLGNSHEESAAMVRRRVNGVLGAMQQHRLKAGTLAGALVHFQKATGNYCPGLFHTYAVPDLPRTNRDPEQLFGAKRYHDRRATGRKTAPLVRFCAARSAGSSPPRPACRIRQPWSWEPRTGSTGRACVSVWRGAAAREPCALAFGTIPSPIWRPSNRRPTS